jgi:hypothetical protein
MQASLNPSIVMYISCRCTVQSLGSRWCQRRKAPDTTMCMVPHVVQTGVLARFPELHRWQRLLHAFAALMLEA